MARLALSDDPLHPHSIALVRAGRNRLVERRLGGAAKITGKRPERDGRAVGERADMPDADSTNDRLGGSGNSKRVAKGGKRVCRTVDANHDHLHERSVAPPGSARIRESSVCRCRKTDPAPALAATDFD